MLGYIYVYTNPMFPKNIINIQFSTDNTDEFSNIINKNYIDPIEIVFIQPTVKIELTQYYLQFDLLDYKKTEQFYDITLKNLKSIIRKIMLQQIIETNIDLYINSQYEMIIH